MSIEVPTINSSILKCILTSEVISDHLQGTLNCGWPSHNLHDEPEQRMMPKEQMSQVGNISHPTKWSSSPENKLREISLLITLGNLKLTLN
jgi:hypothetical protein